MTAVRLGALLMIGSAACWALGLVASKAVLDGTDVSSTSILTVQLGSSVAVLVAVAAARRQRVAGAWRDGWTGVLEPGIAYHLSLAGLATTSAANATVIASLEPVVIPALAWWLLRTRPTRLQWSMTSLATVGALVVAWDGAGGESSVVGDVLVFASVVAAALYVVLSHRQVEHHDPLTLAAAQQGWALGLCLVVAVVADAGGVTAWPSGAAETLAIAGSGLLNYAVPFVLYLAALRYLPVASAAGYLSSIPVFGLAASAALLGESVSVVQVVGAVVVVLALVGLTRRPAPTGADAAPEQAGVAAVAPGD
ncbi:MAG: DMT family transporter [Actinomycetes bacterium]|uniref:Unannotated protein n=1 Tax=freshwater metagenome TaxID=449393 RepID=A0A6J6CNW9_9ZZZZ